MNILKLGSKGEEVRKLQQLLGVKVDGCFGGMTKEAVISVQLRNNLTPDGVVGPKTWAVLMDDEVCPTLLDSSLPGNPVIKKSSRSIEAIIVHCTATPEGRDYTVDTIRKWHKDRGWSDIGYHYVIYRDGSIHNGRDVNLSGAHTENHNARTIGVVYVGGLAADAKTPKDTRTVAQKDSLVLLLKNLMSLYGLKASKVYGHYQFANKACPSFKIEGLRASLT